MTAYDLFMDICFASVLILIGQFLRAKLGIFQRFFIPASMIAGFLGLFLGSQFLNVIPFSSAASSYPGILIIVVFTVVGINGFSKGVHESNASVFRRAASFQLYRFVIFFIQFIFPIAFTLTVLTALVPDLNPGFGILLASGFTGGHGTAASVGSTFASLGWAEANDLGMTFATIGILTGIFGGLAFIKWATKRGYTAYIQDFKFISGDLRTGLVSKENRKPMGDETISSVSLDALAFHLSLVVAISGLGYYLNVKVIAPYVLSGIPDFTVAFLLALVFFLVFRKTPVYDYVDKNINNRISGAASDYLVFFGIATIKISVVVEYALPLTLMSLLGFVLVFVVVLPLGFLMNKDSWFERSLFCYGYSTGVFAIGFVLLRIVDPENKSNTVEDTALTPFLNFIEIAFWSMIPAALIAGQGWLVVGLVSIAAIASIIVAIVGKMWYTTPLKERKRIGIDDITD